MTTHGCRMGRSCRHRELLGLRRNTDCRRSRGYSPSNATATRSRHTNSSFSRALEGISSYSRRLWDSVAVRSCIDACFLQWPKRDCRGPERRRGGKVSPRIAPRIQNTSPFVQTHGSLDLSRPWPADHRSRAC
jgi:hypothetical protein